MKIFVSWSGDLSHKVALYLKNWFPNVIQTVELYVSSEDIDKGARWFAEVGTKLQDAQFGIVCLTRENMKAPWVLFEAGAISKTVDQSRVTPLLIDLSPADLQGPLVQFQATTATESDIKRLTKTINSITNSPLKDNQLERSFDKWWPDFELFMNEVASTTDKVEAKQRGERELLEEVLQHVRAIARALPSPKVVADAPGLTSTLASKIKRGLEGLGKPLLAVALDGAQKVTMGDKVVNIQFAPEGKYLRDTLMKPENMKILRGVACGVIGKEVGIRVSIKESLEIEEPSDEKRIREAAEQHPTIQQLLKTFRAEIVDVQRAEAGETDGSEEADAS